jgi:glucose-1-phosphate adenylyltransferase
VKKVVAMILAGGEGDRLSVLSEERAKPAVMFGGRYRVIDFALSNCANSGITRVGVLTQYRPRSLNEHIGIGRPWDLDRAGGGVSLLQPYRAREASDWYKGTADAVYQNLYYIEEARPELVLVLAGDHVYKMNYDELINNHVWQEADVTIPVYEVPMEEASRYGTLVLDEDDRIVDFDEKPERPRSNLISMGIYLFNTEVLIEALEEDARRRTGHDFGGDIVPALVGQASLFGYRFDGYWRDVGTIEAYYDANMDLLEDDPELDLYDAEREVLTAASGLPPAKIGRRAYLSRSLVSVGCTVNGHVEHSILSPRVYVEEGAVVRDSLIFDGALVKSGAIIDRSIVDKEVLVSKNCYVGYGDDFTPNKERPDVVDCGITIIGKRAQLPPDLRVGRNCVIGPGVIAKGIRRNHLASGRTLRLPPHGPHTARL